MAEQKPSVEPSLYRRNGRWYAKLRMGPGQWKNVNTGTDDRKLAREAAQDMQCRVDRGLPAVEAKGAAPTALMTVGELVTRYLAEYQGERCKDLEAYRQKFTASYRVLIEPYLKEARVTTLRRADVRAWLAHLAGEGYAYQTRALAKSRLSAVYRWAIEHEVTDSEINPCERISLGHRPDTERPFYTIEQIQAILDADCPMIFVAAVYSGARRGELRALRWRDVDLDNLVMHIRGSYAGAPKTRSSLRSIPIHRELAPWLISHKAEQTRRGGGAADGLVFPGRDGAMASEQAADGLYSALRRADVPVFDRPFHSARHSLGAHLAAATNGNTDVIARILGHSKGPGAPAITSHYTAHASADLAYLARELNKLTYLPTAQGTGATVIDFQARRRQAKGESEELATNLLPRALTSDGKP